MDTETNETIAELRREIEELRERIAELENEDFVPNEYITAGDFNKGIREASVALSRSSSSFRPLYSGGTFPGWPVSEAFHASDRNTPNE